MNKNCKYIFSRQTLGLMLLLCVSLESFAYDFKVDGFCYNILSSNQVEVTSYSHNMYYSGHIVIPEKVKYEGKEYAVISIGKAAFQSSYYLKSLVISNSVTSIGNNAFWNCDGLTSITISNSVTSIGEVAFYGCSALTSIEIPNSVIYIGSAAFDNCSSLTSIIIPSSVTSIGNAVFSGCSNLTSISVGNGNTKYDSRNNCNAIIETESSTLIAGCKNTIIPNSITCIGDSAFYSCDGLTSITIPNSVVSIGGSAFGVCTDLTSITIPNSVTSIGTGAFSDCYELGCVRSCITRPFSITNYVFYAISSTAKLEVPKGTKSQYQAIPGWSWYFKEIVEFDESPASYTLSITASGNGSATYSSTAIRNNTRSFTVNEGISATITFTPDDGYRIKTVKVNNSTASVSNNQYTISSINANTTVSVEFEAIPPTTYTLSVTASGNGSATYGSTAIRNNTRSFTVNEGTFVTITFTPDDGYRIKTVKVNNSIVSVPNNWYNISSINGNTTISVEFEAIPPTTYTLSVTASGNGSATYGSTTIRNNTRSFTVNEGTSATITFTPDDGYRIKTVKVNNSTVSVSNNQYTISSINANTTVEVEFEEIPVSQFSVDGFYYKVIEDKTNEVELIQDEVYKSYTGDLIIPETVTYNGRSYKITSIGKSAFYDCSGFIGSLYIPSSVTSIGNRAFWNCSGFIGSLSIPGTVISIGNSAFMNCSGFTGSLSIPSSVTYIGESAFSMCSGFTGSLYIPSSVTFLGESAFNECRGLTGTLTIPNTVSSIGINTFRSCGFTGSLIIPNSVTSIGDYAFYGCRGFTGSLTIPNTVSLIGKYSFGSCGFTGTLIIPSSVTSIRESAFSLCSGFTGSLSIPGSVISIGNSAFLGCRGLTSVFIPENVTSIGSSAFYGCNNMVLVESQIFEPFSIDDNVFQGISSVAELKVPKGTKTKYEAFSGWTCNFNKIHEIGVTDTYTLSITVSGNGFVSYDGKTIRDETRNFTVNEGTSVTITFSPDEGYRVKGVNVNGQSVTVTGNQYTIDNINSDVKIEVAFEMIPVSSLAVDGVKYNVVSNEEWTVNVAEGDYGLVLTVPESIEANGLTWKVTGIEDTALNSSPELAAIVWNLDYGFTGNVSNPNLLLYVKSADYAPTAIKNVVVNGVAENIILTDAESGNNFYCPQEFTARSISYDHHYGMTTGIGEARGWETLALPFDVQKVTHTTKGDMTPFAKWKSGDAAKPFWLMELSGNRFVETDAIKANTPYIVSMPNNDLYKSEFRMAGTVRFSANNVTVKASDNLTTASYADRTLTPNFVVKPAGAGCYALNVSNELEKNDSGITEGSRFVLNIRQVHPFEAYMTSTSGARYIELFDDDTTDILKLDNLTISQSGNLYDLQGRKVSGDVRKGVYIKKGKKLIIK